MARRKGRTVRRGARRKRKASTYRKSKPTKAPQEPNKRRKKDQEGNFDETQKHEEKSHVGKTCSGHESYATEDEESMTAETYDNDRKKGKKGRSSESTGRGKRRAGSCGSGVVGGSGKPRPGSHSKPRKDAKDTSKQSDSKCNKTYASESMTTSTKDNKTKGEGKGQKGKNSRKKWDSESDEGSSSSG